MQETSIKQKIIYIENGKLKINKRQLKIRVAVIFIVLLATYFIGEVAVRVLAPQELYNRHDPSHPSYPKEVEYDKDLGWSTVKNYKAQPYTKQGRHPIVTITHNSQGYRMANEVDDSKKKIVMSGDSLVYGFWVDDSKVMSAKLNEMLGNDYQAINLGVGGYGTDQAFLRFIMEGLQYKPKAVVHGFFTNDFSNIVSEYQYNIFKPIFSVSENGSLILKNVPVPLSKDIEKSYPKAREHSVKGFERAMRSWSHLYVLYKNKKSVIKSKINHIFSSPKKIDYFNDYKDGEMWAIEKDYTDVMKYSFYLNSRILKAYNDLAKSNNITFVLVLIADRISVDPEMQKATVGRYHNIDGSFFDYEKPYRLLEEFAKREGIKIVNTYPLFKEEYQQKKKSMYLEGDNHLNDYGHELVAKEVYKFLAGEGLVENVK